MSKTFKSIIRSYYCGDLFAEYFDPIYPFTTENISGYIDLFDLKNKSLLTVGSSGDQAINAILKGCNDVTIADINPYMRYYYYLKIASIISLEMDEFLKFLRYLNFNGPYRHNKEVLNPQIYMRIRKTLNRLDQESLKFWDELLISKKNIRVRKQYFTSDEYTTSLIKKCNPYLQSEELYKETRCKVQEVRPHFITQNIITEELFGSYDNIWLSNIGVYIDLRTLDKMVKKATELLRKQGTLLISYLYSFTKDTKYQYGWDPIYDLKATLSILQRFNPELQSFDGIEEQDSILLCHK